MYTFISHEGCCDFRGQLSVSVLNIRLFRKSMPAARSKNNVTVKSLRDILIACSVKELFVALILGPNCWIEDFIGSLILCCYWLLFPLMSHTFLSENRSGLQAGQPSCFCHFCGTLLCRDRCLLSCNWSETFFFIFCRYIRVVFN